MLIVLCPLEFIYQRASSRTTRIKTAGQTYYEYTPTDQRASSRTTRIKTCFGKIFNCFDDIREHLPEQQGLRLCSSHP